MSPTRKFGVGDAVQDAAKQRNGDKARPSGACRANDQWAKLFTMPWKVALLCFNALR